MSGHYMRTGATKRHATLRYLDSLSPTSASTDLRGTRDASPLAAWPLPPTSSRNTTFEATVSSTYQPSANKHNIPSSLPTPAPRKVSAKSKPSSPNPSHTHTSSHLPPSPYYYTTPSSPLVLKFYSYGHPLPLQPVLIILNTALRDVNAQLHPEDIIPDRILRYSSGEVYLLIHHRTTGRMTWEVFEGAVWGLMDFVERYECVDFDFDVGEFGMERVFGTGVLGGFG